MSPRARFDADLLAIRPRLMGWAMKRLRDKTSAEDVVSNAVMKALRSWEQFTPGTNFGGWMHRILFNEMVTLFRRQKHTPVSMDVEEIDTMAQYQPRQDDLYDQGKVRRVMATMPIQMRHVLLRICVEGWTYEETADEIGVTVGTIKSRLFRARSTMEQMLTR